MDRKVGGMSILSRIHGVFFVLWVIVSVTLYGSACMVLGVISKKIARKVATLWNIHLLKIAGIKLVVSGLEKIDTKKRYVYFANHQSALDIPVIASTMKTFVCFMAKKELFAIPIFGWGMRSVGHVWVDRSNARKARESISRAVVHLKKEHISLVLFPEGTRSEDGKIKEFKQASFTLAVEAGVEVVPLVLHDTRLCLPKGRAMATPGTIHLEICDPITVTPQMTKGDICTIVYNTICKAAERGPVK
jgi:1-acyl-sn-glycerol-3-phosphate acyltransferase